MGISQAEFERIKGNLGITAVADPQRIENFAPKDPMNSWERQFAEGELEPRVLAGEIIWWEFEPFKLRLGEGAYYTPDFGVLLKTGGLVFYEIKGFWREAAKVRIKAAADRYPFWFIAVTKDSSGEWTRQIFKGRGGL